MAWQTPKTDWAAEDGVLNTDFNRIEGNIQYLSDTRGGLTETKYVYVSVTGGNDSTGTGSSDAPYATITKAVSTIQKNLNGYNAFIYLAAGTYNEDVVINDFYAGMIALIGWGSSPAVTIRSLNVQRVTSFAVRLMSSLSTTGPLTVGDSSSAKFQVPVSATVSSDTYGIGVNNAAAIFEQTVTVSNKASFGALISNSATVFFIVLAGTNNGTAIAVLDAVCRIQVITITGTTRYLTSNGGRIYSGAQTNIPQY